ncbi:MAG: hypothetical protein ABI824_17325 [Acidobacteriota bacterium]
MRTLIFIAFTAVALAQPKLSVQSASSKQVSISWTGITGPAAIERRPAGGKYEPLTKLPQGQTYTDAAIDAMGTYQYRVHADMPGAAASNEVIAGPPPTGYTIPLATPKAFLEKDAQANFARSTSMELDGNGDPAILYSVLDPTFNDGKEAELWFLHWDRAAYRWKAPVKVATFQVYRNYITLAHDQGSAASAGTWATVAEGEAGIELYVSSDDGATWTMKHRLAVPEITVLGRAVAMFNGQLYWLHSIDADGTYLLSGALSDDPSKWKEREVASGRVYGTGFSKRRPVNCHGFTRPTRCDLFSIGSQLQRDRVLLASWDGRGPEDPGFQWSAERFP